MDWTNLEFYRGKRVFVTGHTGFKGSWLCRILLRAGAIVTGYSLKPTTEPNLFSMADIEGNLTSVIGDIRNIDILQKAFAAAAPEIVFHLAAQPIVRDSYSRPVYTYETNVLGTVYLLECVRTAQAPVKSVVIITTDKVYLNDERNRGYREDDCLDGHDPYSNSKSCSELVTHSYARSFFQNGAVAVSTVRAGNVIGGGDFANDRIIPDCIRAVRDGKIIIVRNPDSIRPYQHVLDSLFAYLMIAQKQYEDRAYAGWYNIGPDACDCIATGDLVDMFCRSWGRDACWETQVEANAPHEAGFLKLDCTKIKGVFGWQPRWHIQEAVEKTCEWTRVCLENGDVAAEMDREIQAYIEG